MVCNSHVPNGQYPLRLMRYIIQSTIIPEQILSFCVGQIIHAWQQRRTIPSIIANSFVLNTRNDISFTHNRTHPDTTHHTTHTQNWIRAHTYATLAHLHIWLLTFHHDTPPSIRLLRVWLNTHAKSWYANDAITVFRIPNVLNTNRYQVSIMPINTDNGIMQIAPFDSKYASNPYHTARLDLLDPMGQPLHHSYDVSGRPRSGSDHSLTRGGLPVCFEGK